MGNTNYIPVRYIGDHDVLLNIGQMKASGRPLVNGFGEPLKPTLNNAVDGLPAYGLRYGDTLMMPDTEVLGQTYLHDPQQQQPSEFIGAGKVIKKEHEGLSVDELSALGYEFMGGRSDFEPFNLLSGTNTSLDPVATPVASPVAIESIVENVASSDNDIVPEPVVVEEQA